MTPRRAQIDLLETLSRSSGAREASWSSAEGAPLRFNSGGSAGRRPSWPARLGERLAERLGEPQPGARSRPEHEAGGSADRSRAGLLTWGPEHCARDPLLAAAGIREVRGWQTVCGGRLLLGGDGPLELSARELELQARALAALERAGGGAADLARLGLSAAGVAHDLRNLLAVAQLEVEAAGLGRPGTEARLQTTLREARGVAEGFLQGEGAARRQVTVLAPVLQRAAARAPEIAHLPRERRVELRVVCPEDLFVVGREEQLARVFDNLFANAAAAAAGAGEAQAEPVECRARRVGDRVQVEVCDRGRGLSARDLTRVLAPGSSASGGTGWGTSSVRECLELLSGVLEIESAPGAGTTCRVSLRSAPAPGTAVTLVVSRDPALRAAWVSALRGRGVEGLAVSDATEGLAWSEVLELRGVLWARGTPGKGRRTLQRAVRERGRPWCELGVRGPAPRTPGERGAHRVLDRMASR